MSIPTEWKWHKQQNWTRKKRIEKLHILLRSVSVTLPPAKEKYQADINYADTLNIFQVKFSLSPRKKYKTIQKAWHFVQSVLTKTMYQNKLFFHSHFDISHSDILTQKWLAEEVLFKSAK